MGRIRTAGLLGLLVLGAAAPLLARPKPTPLAPLEGPPRRRGIARTDPWFLPLDPLRGEGDLPGESQALGWTVRPWGDLASLGLDADTFGQRAALRLVPEPSIVTGLLLAGLAGISRRRNRRD